MNRRAFLRTARSGGFALAAGTLLSGSLAACGSSSGSGDEVTLDFPTWQSDEAGVGDWWRRTITNHQNQHANVTIKLSQVPFASYVNTLTQRFSASRPPDIVHLPSANFSAFASQGWLDSLDERVRDTDVSSMWAPLQQTMTWDGKTYGVLLLGYAPILYYNEKMLGEAGVSVPTTPDQLLDAARRLTGGGRFGFGATTSNHPGLYGEVTWFVYGSGATWITGDELQFTSPGVTQALEMYRELAKQSPKGVVSEQRRTFFYDAKVAMTMDGPFIYSALEQKASAENRPHLKVARVPLPQTPGFPSNSIHIAADIDDDRKAAVWDYIRSLLTHDVQVDYARSYKVPSPRKDVLGPELVSETPALELFQKETEKANVAQPDNKKVQENFNEFQKLIIDAVVRLQSTTDPTSTVLADLQDKVAKATQL
jgi:multiple sugar transport system substrate-binding protein